MSKVTYHSFEDNRKYFAGDLKINGVYKVVDDKKSKIFTNGDLVCVIPITYAGNEYDSVIMCVDGTIVPNWYRVSSVSFVRVGTVEDISYKVSFGQSK